MHSFALLTTILEHVGADWARGLIEAGDLPVAA